MSRGYGTKECRELVEAVEDAGGTITFTRRGHLLVKGPKGLTTVSSKLKAPREIANARADLARYSGIEIAL